jgi:hypothetical protein
MPARLRFSMWPRNFVLASRILQSGLFKSQSGLFKSSLHPLCSFFVNIAAEQ